MKGTYGIDDNKIKFKKKKEKKKDRKTRTESQYTVQVSSGLHLKITFHKL